MTDYIPLSGSTGSLENNPEEYKSLFEIPDPSIFSDISTGLKPLPSKLEDLTNERTESVKLSVDTALKLKIPIGETENKIARSIFIQEYKKYKVETKKNQDVHVGISIRWVINIEKLHTSADISSLPMITASGQFNYVNASASFEVNGISSEKITNLIPAPKDLNNETFLELNDSFIKIKNEIWNPETTLRPKIIGVIGNLKDKEQTLFAESATVAYALEMIAQRKSLRKCLNKIKDEMKIKIIKSVYLEIIGSLDQDFIINGQNKLKARKYLEIV